MSPRMAKEGKPQGPKDAGGAEGVDPARAAFTSAIVAALKDLEHRKAPNHYDLGQRAYQKLQYDLPLVSTEELHGLAQTLRSSLQLKSSQPPFPLTSKLLENVVSGARAPLATAPAHRPQLQQAGVSAETATPPASADGKRQASSGAQAASAGAASAAPGAGCCKPVDAADDGSDAAARQTPAHAPAQHPEAPASLLHTELASSDLQAHSSAYRTLCAVVFVQLVSHCLAVSEQDTWALLYGVEPSAEEEDAGNVVGLGCGGGTDLQPQQRLPALPGLDGGKGEGAGEGDTAAVEPTGRYGRGFQKGDGAAAASSISQGQLPPSDLMQCGQERAVRQGLDSGGRDGADNGVDSNGHTHDDSGPSGPSRALERSNGGADAVTGAGSADAAEAGEPAAAGDTAAVSLAHQQQQEGPGQRVALYDEVVAAEEDGDDFVFEDLDLPGTASSAPGTGTGGNSTAITGLGGPRTGALQPSAGAFCLQPSPPPPPLPYTWPALRARLLRLAGQVSYALLDEPDLWRDGQLLQGVFALLRALGAHRHAQELAPLLHAYVGLVADRIVAAPDELACLDSLWDAVGLPCIASLPPQVSRNAAAAAAVNGGSTTALVAASGGRREPGALLLAEASTCLSLVASLSGQLTGASAKLRLWQQVHKHMLPLLERCLGELAKAVGRAPTPGARTGWSGAVKAGAGLAAAKAAQPEPRGPGPEEVAAIVLVCQVLDFYVQQRPGNVDLAASLKGTGVLASLSVLFAAAADLTGAEPLRSAALCCAASSRELHGWMLAVPGVSKALAAPAFQEGGSYEAHGALWELLGGGGSSPVALGILAGGAAPEKAVRVHSLLQLMARAAACRGGRGNGSGSGGLWDPSLEGAMRKLFAALREEQAVGSLAAVGKGGARVERASGGEGSEGGEQGGGQAVGRLDEEEEEKEDGDDDEKLHLLDPAALARRRARQLHPVCWRILKQLLTASGDTGSKTD